MKLKEASPGNIICMKDPIITEEKFLVLKAPENAKSDMVYIANLKNGEISIVSENQEIYDICYIHHFTHRVELK